ncbi:hypothetical protein K2X05_13180, partial [bacterium]|nr:hypothetical protein [bacterium]
PGMKCCGSGHGHQQSRFESTIQQVPVPVHKRLFSNQTLQLQFSEMILLSVNVHFFETMMVFSFLMGSVDMAFAGNDPGIIQMREMSTNIYPLTAEEIIRRMYEQQRYMTGDGNDPGRAMFPGAARDLNIAGIDQDGQVDWSQYTSKFNFADSYDLVNDITDEEIEDCGWQIDNAGGELKFVQNSCLKAIKRTSFGVCGYGVSDFCSLIPKVFMIQSDLTNY